MWRATLKSLLARKVRLALTALAVVLGVGFVAGTYVLTDTLDKAFDELFTTTTAGVDVVVQAKSAFTPVEGGGGGGGQERNPVPEGVARRIEAIGGVQRVVGDVAGYAQIVDPRTGKAITTAGAPTLGANWDPLTGLVLRRGRAPTGPGEMAVDAGTAGKYDLAVGDRVQVLFQGPSGEFTISGIVGVGELDNLLGATLSVFDTETAQRVLGRQGEFDTVNVVARPGVSPIQLRNAVAAALPKGFEVLTGADAATQSAEQLRQGLGFLRTALLVFGFVSLFVGAFIIFNTFSIIVAQRTRELGLLRALGASRRQVMVSVMGEAVAIGLAASAVGIGAGVLIAVGLQALLRLVGVELPSTATQVLPRTFVVSLVIGTVVTFVASVIPARRASRVAPVQALREEGAPPGGSLRRRIAIGFAVTGLGLAALLTGLFGGGSHAAQLVGLGAAMVFLGVAILSPLVARRIAGWLGAPLRRLSFSGKMGRENSMRNPRRTAATAAALMIGLGLVTFVAVFAASLRSSASAALDETLRADFIVSSSQFQPFSAQVARDLAARPELGVVSPFRQGEIRVGGRTDFVAGVDPSTIAAVAAVDVAGGSLHSLGDGALLVYRGVARSHGWKTGDTVTVEFAKSGKRKFTIGGIFTDNRLLNNYVVSLPVYQRNFAGQLDMIVFVKARKGVPIDRARRAVDQVAAKYPNVEVNDQASFKARQAGFINRFLALVSALLGLAILIALFGIVNTLGLSIFERTRELGLLRAVGMSRRQVKRMIRWEAVIIAVLGALLGVVIGVLFGWTMQRALADQGISRFALPVGTLVAYVILAGFAGVLAAILPARRAARLNILEAIAYE